MLHTEWAEKSLDVFSYDFSVLLAWEIERYVFKDMATEIRKMVVTLRCIAKT